MFEDLSGDVAFEASHDLETVELFGSTAGHVGSGFWVVAHPGENDPVQSRVGVTVTAPVEPVSHSFA